ncbi:MAG: hypothetical protein IJY93_01350 [Clostridia bacterium]|nr:hypothetical protein [Clostridia bacterium]
MNETANNTDILKPLSDLLRHTDDKIVSLAITIEHIKSLMYFLGDFFSFETISPERINDRDTRDKAVLHLYNYPHYRSLYETISAMLMDGEDEAERIGQCIDNAMTYILAKQR